jgi:two-component system NtrC family sensor kinase
MQTKISYKLIAAVGLVAIVIIGVFAYFILGSHEEQLIAELERSAHQLSETVKSSTRHDMLLNQRESVHRIINTIGRQQGIEKLRIFNKDGAIIYSTDSLDAGQMVDKQAEACYACHAADPAPLPLEVMDAGRSQPLTRLPISETTRIFQTKSAGRMLGVINPIYNEPSCWQSDCHAHDAQQQVLGVLDITMPLDEVDSGMKTSRMRLILFTIIAIAAISLIIFLLVELIVLKPVNRIVDATHKVAAGDLNYKISLNKNDEIGELAHAFDDMTHKLADTQRQLYQSERLASVGRLAAGVAHEINNPLTGVLTYSSFALKRVNGHTELKEDLEVIVRETKRCRDIVKGLLDFARQSPPEKTRASIHEIIDHAVQIVHNQLDENKIKVEKKLQPNLPPLFADASQIQQVLVNLLLNASDAIGKDGGMITISAAMGNGDQDLKGPCLQVTVNDTGCGIPPEDLPKIFDPFFSTKGKKGTGLGLAVVWGIIEKHGGKISVESEVGKGTTFKVLLPIYEESKIKTNS